MKYLFIVFIFCACNQRSQHNEGAKIPAEILDTIKSSPPGVISKPFLFETAFIKGTTEKAENSTVYFTGITIGKLKIVSGRIIACDPLHIDEYGKPFTQVFPAGEFPVQLSILKVDGDESIAFARVNFSNEPVVRWELALLQGQQPVPVGSTKERGFCVDAGMGIFVDEVASKALDFEKMSSTDAGVYKEMEKHYHRGWRYGMYNFGNYNLASFTTGLGDGCYNTYTGFDAKGKPCRLLIDFGIFDWRATYTSIQSPVQHVIPDPSHSLSNAMILLAWPLPCFTEN